MAGDALQRLYESNNQEESNYSLDEQMDSAKDDDFLDGMSDASKSALFKATEITLDDEEEDDNDTDIIFDNPEDLPNNSQNEVLFNNNKVEEQEKPKKKRGRKPQSETNKPVTNNSNGNFNPIMNQLAKDIIDELRRKDFKINRFNKDQMNIVFDYMYDKF